MMGPFEEITAKHHQMLVLQKTPPPGFSDQIQDFLNELQASGRTIYNSQQRDQLRSYIRYWSSSLYELQKGKGYQMVDLDAYAGPVGSSQPSRAQLITVGMLGVLLIVMLIIGGIAAAIYFFTPVPVTPTPVPSLPSAVSPSLVPTFPPTPVPPTATPTRSPTPLLPTATPTPTPTRVAAPLLTISSPANGAAVQPETTFRGAYQSMRPGWSIHLVVQPLSKSGKYFPIKNYFQVPANLTTGEWIIPVNFETQFNLATADTYVVSLAALNSDNLRAIFDRGGVSGLDSLPNEAIVVDALLTIRRTAFRHVREVQLVFAGNASQKIATLQQLLPQEKNLDLFSASLDGKTVTRLTNTPGVDEYAPALSPDGKRIVYVAERTDTGSKHSMTLEVMDSNGANRATLLGGEGQQFEHPAWSPDGKTIAYAARTGNEPWSIFNIDFELKRPIQLTKGEPSNNHPSWLKGGALIVFTAVSAQTKTTGLFTVDRSGNIERLLDTERQDIEPVVSPDGAQVAFVALDEASGASEISVLDLTKKETRKITEKMKDDSQPCWHPNGSQIFFVSSRGSPTAIWTVNADGKGPRQLISAIAEPRDPFAGYMDAYIPLANEETLKK